MRRWLVALTILVVLVAGLAAGAFIEARDVDADEEHIAAEIRGEIGAVRDLHDARLDELQAWAARVQRKRATERLNHRISRLEKELGAGGAR